MSSDQYKDCFVAFIDVLGFIGLTSSQKSEKEVKRYFRASVSLIENIKGRAGKEEIGAFFVGDAVVLAVPVKAGSPNTSEIEVFANLLIAVADFQEKLAFDNFWVCGGVTRGQVLLDEGRGFVLGPALAQAYNIERGIARFPRVVVDPRVIDKFRNKAGFEVGMQTSHDLIEEVNTHARATTAWAADVLFDWRSREIQHVSHRETEHNRFLERDVPIFVDYFSRLNNKDRDSDLNEIVMILERRIREDVNHYAKYRWVANYLVGLLSADQLQFQAAIERLREL